MIILASTADKVQVISSAVAALDVHASWLDNASGAVTPGRTNSAITTATTTDVVGSPASGVQRNLETLHIRNKHVTNSCDVTVQHTDGTTVVQLHKVTLAAGAALQYVDKIGFALAPGPLASIGAGLSSFSVHKNSVDQTGIATSTWTQITFSTEVYDVGNNFASSAWTPPAGKIHLDAAFGASGTLAAGTTVYFAIYKNGVSFKQSTGAANTVNQCGAVISVDDVANGTDVYTVWCYVTTTSGTVTIFGAPVSTYFMGHMI